MNPDKFRAFGTGEVRTGHLRAPLSLVQGSRRPQQSPNLTLQGGAHDAVPTATCHRFLSFHPIKVFPLPPRSIDRSSRLTPLWPKASVDPSSTSIHSGALLPGTAGPVTGLSAHAAAICMLSPAHCSSFFIRMHPGLWKCVPELQSDCELPANLVVNSTPPVPPLIGMASPAEGRKSFAWFSRFFQTPSLSLRSLGNSWPVAVEEQGPACNSNRVPPYGTKNWQSRWRVEPVADSAPQGTATRQPLVLSICGPPPIL